MQLSRRNTLSEIDYQISLKLVWVCRKCFEAATAFIRSTCWWLNFTKVLNLVYLRFLSGLFGWHHALQSQSSIVPSFSAVLSYKCHFAPSANDSTWKPDLPFRCFTLSAAQLTPTTFLAQRPQSSKSCVSRSWQCFLKGSLGTYVPVPHIFALTESVLALIILCQYEDESNASSGEWVSLACPLSTPNLRIS